METAKDIIVKVLPSQIANVFVKKWHYSGKVVNSSQLHFGAFLNGDLHGVMSYGCPLDKRKVLGLVVDEHGEPAPWNDMLELNRMAFDNILPKNSESRCIAISIRMIKKNAPNIKWLLSFADGTHCGDGTIYRASGFKLTGISKGSMIELPEKYWALNGGGKYAHRLSLQSKSSIMHRVMEKDLQLNGMNKQLEWYAEKLGTKIVEGFQFRYIKITDDRYRLSVSELPFNKIGEVGGGMYLGQKR